MSALARFRRTVVDGVARVELAIEYPADAASLAEDLEGFAARHAALKWCFSVVASSAERHELPRLNADIRTLWQMLADGYEVERRIEAEQKDRLQ